MPSQLLSIDTDCNNEITTLNNDDLNSQVELFTVLQHELLYLKKALQIQQEEEEYMDQNSIDDDLDDIY